MSSKTPETVLITGVNGFIGYATTVEALKQGYHVVAAVRRQDAVEYALRGQSIQPYYLSKALQFVIIPDMAQKTAFVEAAKGCSCILHIANPLGHVPGDLYSPAVGGVEALIHAAEVTPTIKRIVWTGSVLGNIPFERMFTSHPYNVAVAAGEPNDVPYLTGDTVVKDPPPVAADGPGLQRYNWGKVVATNRLRAYAEAHADDPKPRFDIVITVPGWVMGPSELPQTQQEAMDGLNTNSVLLFLYTPLYKLNGALGLPDEADAPLLGCTLHIDDCAKSHVAAIESSFKGNLRSYILCSDGPSGPKYMDAIEIIKKHHPDAAEKIRPDAYFGTIKSKHDSSAAEQDLLGQRFQPFQRIIIDTIGWFKQLPDAKT